MKVYFEHVKISMKKPYAAQDVIPTTVEAFRPSSGYGFLQTARIRLEAELSLERSFYDFE
ncbi:hypothetical protein GWA01_17880 [Gluconobacter wancherniae NBRC 103581]|uniref:Uncharacterized protein n=1 Tax=Gluconobacter wancherniae NBRC 103581 TaxID=656744 RepID=A0A511B0N7_9PROT|nr:hypothetical protein GWA01_17880 [Gluconobacter wancherniae NBRC 103581]